MSRGNTASGLHEFRWALNAFKLLDLWILRLHVPSPVPPVSERHRVCENAVRNRVRQVLPNQREGCSFRRSRPGSSELCRRARPLMSAFSSPKLPLVVALRTTFLPLGTHYAFALPLSCRPASAMPRAHAPGHSLPFQAIRFLPRKCATLDWWTLWGVVTVLLLASTLSACTPWAALVLIAMNCMPFASRAFLCKPWARSSVAMPFTPTTRL